MKKYIKNNKMELATRIIANSIQQEESLSILLQGVPGSGKTFFAQAIADELELPLFRYDANEESNSGLIVSFDLEGIIKREAAYIKGALWQAFESEKPCILLIDEIDKSPRSFEAFLLRTTDEQSFSGLKGQTISAKSPVMFIFTSNQRRELSPEFLRRNFRISVDYPKGRVLSEILKQEVGHEHRLIPIITRIIDTLNGKIEPDELPAPKELGLLIQNSSFCDTKEDYEALIQGFFLKNLTIQEINKVLSFNIVKALKK